MVKKLFKMYEAQSHLLYKTVLFKTLESLFLGSAFIFIYLTIRDLLEGTLTQYVAIYYVLAFLLSLGLAYIAATVQDYIVETQVYLIFAKERIRLGDYIKNLPMGFLDNKGAGELSNTLTESIHSIEPVLHILGKVVAILVLSSVFFVVFIITDWRMAIALLAGMPLAIYMLLKVRYMAETEELKWHNIQGHVSETAVEFVSGIQEVKAFGKTINSLKKYQQAIIDFREQNLKIVRLALPKLLIYQRWQ